MCQKSVTSILDIMNLLDSFRVSKGLTLKSTFWSCTNSKLFEQAKVSCCAGLQYDPLHKLTLL